MDDRPPRVEGLFPPKVEACIASAYAGLVLLGIVLNRADVSLCGVVAFAIALALDTVRQHRLAKQFARNEPADEAPPPTAVRIVGWINSALAIGGLGLFVVGGALDLTKDFVYVALGLWIAPILSYFIGGMIADMVGGLPLRLGYGGWEKRRRPRR